MRANGQEEDEEGGSRAGGDEKRGGERREEREDEWLLVLEDDVELPEGSTLHPAPCTLHPAPCTLHPAPCTLHPAFCPLHPAPAWNPSPRTRTLSVRSHDRETYVSATCWSESTSSMRRAGLAAWEFIKGIGR